MARQVFKTVLLVGCIVSILAAPQVRFGDSAVKTSGCGIHNGADRPEGSSWGASDGCNTCTCVSGVAACTLMACSEEPPCRDVLGNFRHPGAVLITRGIGEKMEVIGLMRMAATTAGVTMGWLLVQGSSVKRNPSQTGVASTVRASRDPMG